jgi:hypothetical protein
VTTWAALLCTALLAVWIRAQPLPMPPAAHVILAAGAAVATGIALALVRQVERDVEGG